MITLRATIKLHTAFGTPLVGDTLFGQLCWAAREQLGNEALAGLLEGYTSGKPWLVVSDGFPSGYLPKPTVPVGANSFAQANVKRADESAPTNAAQQRKAEKNKRWLPVGKAGIPLKEWMALAATDQQAFGAKPVEAPQPHNTINRHTGTTGNSEFAPYTQPQIFHARDQRIDLYLALDETRLPQEALIELLKAVGSHGFGRDASIGLGKFSVESVSANSFAQRAQNRSNEFEPTKTAYLTLAPCAPQGQGLNGDQSYWRVITRFGRHGNRHGISEKPFKNPVLLAATGAVFVPQEAYSERAYIGQGLGSDGQLSKTEPATVQQGYAPVIGIRMEG